MQESSLETQDPTDPSSRENMDGIKSWLCLKKSKAKKKKKNLLVLFFQMNNSPSPK